MEFKTPQPDILVSFCPGSDMSECPRRGKVAICATASPGKSQSEIISFLREILAWELKIVGIEARACDKDTWRRACVTLGLDFEGLVVAGELIMDEHRSMVRDCEKLESERN